METITETKMKRTLTWKSILSWTYLLMAAAIFWYVYQNFKSSFINYDDFFDLFTLLPSSMIVLGCICGLYLMHFIYGAFYFPYVYRGIMADPSSRTYMTDINDKDDQSTDFSSGRGYFAGILAVFPYCVYWSQHNWVSSPEMIAPIPIWILLTILLALLTRTDNLFERKSATLDFTVLLPEIFKDLNLEDENDYIAIGGYSYGRYCRLYYSLPKKMEDPKTWETKAVRGFINELREEWQEEERQKKEFEDAKTAATKFSQSVSRY